MTRAALGLVFSFVLLSQIAAGCDCSASGVGCNFSTSGVTFKQHDGRCDSCSCTNVSSPVQGGWAADSALSGELRTFSPAMAQIVADLQVSAVAGHLCSAVLKGQTILVFGDLRTIVSWRYFSLRDGTDRLETDKGEVFEASSKHWSLLADGKEVASGEIAESVKPDVK